VSTRTAWVKELPSRTEPDYLRTIESACEGDSARTEAWTKGNRDMISGGFFDEIMFNAYKILKGWQLLFADDGAP
jgi:hypothetical protein